MARVIETTIEDTTASHTSLVCRDFDPSVAHFGVDVLLVGNETTGWVDGDELDFRHTLPSMSAPQSRMVIADFLGF